MNIVKEVVNEQDIAFVYYREKDLREFKEKSGSLTSSNEYQCHYDALKITEKFDDGSRVFHIFPLVYYNYPQQVSSVTVDFDMKDVSKVAELVDKHTMNKYREIREKLSFFERKSVSFTLTRFNNIHKHP